MAGGTVAAGSIKGSSSVPVPHDGPLLHGLRRRRSSRNTEDDDTKAEEEEAIFWGAGYDEARMVLRSFFVNDNGNDEHYGEGGKWEDKDDGARAQANTDAVAAAAEASRRLLSDFLWRLDGNDGGGGFLSSIANADESYGAAGGGGGGDVRVQLRALRSYRSTVLHVAKKITDNAKTESAIDVDDDAAIERGREKEAEFNERDVVVGTYRILLELSASVRTPTAMRRAAKGCLDASAELADALALDDGKGGGAKEVGGRGEDTSMATAVADLSSLRRRLGEVRVAVVSSVVVAGGASVGDGTGSSWSDATSALFELLSYRPTRDNFVVAECSTLSGGDDAVGNHGDNVRGALRMLLDAGGSVKPLLDSRSFHRRCRESGRGGAGAIEEDVGTGGSKISDNGAEASPSSSSQPSGAAVIKAVECAVQIASTLKLLLSTLLREGSEGENSLTATAVSAASVVDDGGEHSDTHATVAMRTNNQNEEIIELLSRLEDVVLRPLLLCDVTNVDGLSVAGVCLGQCLLLRWTLELELGRRKGGDDGDVVVAAPTDRDDELALRAATIATTECASSGAVSSSTSSTSPPPFPPLSALAVVRGLAASLPDSVLLRRLERNVDGDGNEPWQQPLLCRPLGSTLADRASSSSDPAVRLSALRGLDAVLGRAASALIDDDSGDVGSAQCAVVMEDLRCLAQTALDLVLVAWESPPCRQVSCAIPGLFESLVRLMQALPSPPPADDDVGGNDALCSSSTTTTSSIDLLVERLLAQPPNRKGRYVALETLLPVVSAKKILSGGGYGGGGKLDGVGLVPSLVRGIGDPGGSNAGAIADLLGRLLSQLREEMNADAGVIDVGSGGAGGENKKQRRKREIEMARRRKQVPNTLSMESVVGVRIPPSQLLPGWVELWAPHVALALLAPSSTRRIQTAAFCLPLIETIVGGPTRRVEASHAFAALLREVDAQFERDFGGWRERSNAEREGNALDCLLWAKLEIARHASSLKLTKGSSAPIIYRAFAVHLPLASLKAALRHGTSSIRLAGFYALESVLPSHQSNSDTLSLELALWKGSLPYAFKSDDKEYISKLLKCLVLLLNRLSNAVAESEEGDAPRMGGGEANILVTFVCDFLINDVVIKQAAYPGTVAEKEGFALSLLRTIFTFASEDVDIKPGNSSERKKLTKKNIMHRILTPLQIASNISILRALLSDVLFSSLFSLMHSIWDRTRASAFDIMRDFALHARKVDLPLPTILESISSREGIYARGIHLASSPRQREADAGAKMLALLCITFSSQSQQSLYIDNLVKLLQSRVSMMEHALGVVMMTNKCEKPDSARTSLPMAYGIVHALRLSVESRDLGVGKDFDDISRIYKNIAEMCCNSIEVSLAVVADLKADPDEGDLDVETYDIRSISKRRSGATPLNVNTGAIGANASFAAVEAKDENEEIMRSMIQRIVMGSWLLTKEACATLASVMAGYPCSLPVPLVATAGSLLISTLTSLKHQGAAFAAHKALQQLSSTCSENAMNSDSVSIQSFPFTWARRLLYEISSTEIVRDSTLRRSTGYALGFLSLMRSEPPSSVAPRTICQHVLANIIRLSLPSSSSMKQIVERWKPGTSPRDIFTFAPHCQVDLFVDDSNYEARCRVHALNILRLAILDAPLASDIRPFIGDAIIASIIGYNDEAWSVRNSSTMVFAAAMLRVVDADKNASSIELSMTSRASGNAITARELFRSYPSLPSFILSIMVEEIEDSFGPSKSRQIHPSLFPLLLLFARLQPASFAADLGSNQLARPFIQPVFRCLSHRHHKVRLMASRALAVLCSGANDSVSNKDSSSTHHVLSQCLDLLGAQDCGALNGMDWNARHGALLGIKAIILTCSRDQYSILLNQRLTTALALYSLWGAGAVACPPSCAAVALETWAYVAQSDNRYQELKVNDHEATSFSLARVVYDTLESIELVESRGEAANMIGLAHLCNAAAKTACDISCHIIFDLSNDFTTRTLHLNHMKRLFNSALYDVRQFAVKAFKKRVNEVASATSEGEQRGTAMISVSEMLLATLFEEMKLREGNLGPHSPSLRRLSRCTLKCLAVYKAYFGHPKLPVGGSCTREEQWNMFVKLRLSGGSSLSGNAVELMAYFLGAGDFGGFIEKSDMFVEFLAQLADPACPWTVRYSAAVAIETCNILGSTGDKPYAGYSELLQKQRLELCMVATKLLQDDDKDVRHVAGRALSGIVPEDILWNRTTRKKSAQAISTVSLVTLEKAHQCLCMQYKSLLWRLVNKLLEGFQPHSLSENLKFVLEEFSFSEEGNDSMNLSMKRKIFEDEHPNPFLEALLVTHLIVSTLVSPQMRAMVDDSFRQQMMSNILNRCYATLSLVKSRALPENSFVHDLSWSNHIFPSMHGLIVASATAIFLGCGDQQGLGRISSAILDQVCSPKANMIAPTLIHPCIREALRVLSTAEKGSEDTRNGIFRCCFLLPGAVDFGVV